MKPKAPKKQTRPETAAVVAAWLAIVAAATTAARVETMVTVIPIAYAADE